MISFARHARRGNKSSFSSKNIVSTSRPLELLHLEPEPPQVVVKGMV